MESINNAYVSFSHMSELLLLCVRVPVRACGRAWARVCVCVRVCTSGCCAHACCTHLYRNMTIIIFRRVAFNL